MNPLRRILRRILRRVGFRPSPPKDWWEYHSMDCGTKYRGCAPECPKDIYENTGEWKGP